MLEDEENVWSIDTWVQRHGKTRGVSFEPEYTFGGGNSLQVELTRLLGRDGAESGRHGEIELKHIFNDIARDGWAVALSAAFSRSRSDGGSERGLTVKLPVSVAFGDSGLVHVNPGIEKRSGERRAGLFALGAEHELMRRVVLFAEVSREPEQRYGAIGVRHWLRKEKLALDVTLQQYRKPGGERAGGFIVGMSFYDL